MTNIIQAIRGMNDIFYPDIQHWQYAEAIFRSVFARYGFSEIRFPLVEHTALFLRSIGAVTDIVEKEVYTFSDRNGDSLSLRPEGTAGCVRLGIEQGLLYNQIQRFWYIGPFFRHERPQKGRYRQFHQCGGEVFGLPGPDIDSEIILLTAHLLKELGLENAAVLNLNSLGSPVARSHYRQALQSYLENHRDDLDEESRTRLAKNPLRILDSKNPQLQTILQQAPTLTAYLDEHSLNHFETLQKYLRQANLAFTINPTLVRGLDYYNNTVFEWTTTYLGAQGAICGGGRYDHLVSQLGGKETPAVGFSMGLERLILLMKQIGVNSPIILPVHVYLMAKEHHLFGYALQLAQELREQLPNLRLMLHCESGSGKNQMKKADKSGAFYALVLDADIDEQLLITVKSLRTHEVSKTLKLTDLKPWLAKQIALLASDGRATEEPITESR